MIPAASTSPLAACAVSGHLDTRTAGMEIAERLHDTMGDTCDLAVLFASFHHRAAFREAAESIRQTINPHTMLGVTTEGVVGEDRELEGLAGMSVLALRLPGTRLQPWISTPRYPIRISAPETIPERLGLSDDFRAAILFADPYSVPITRLVPAITSCRGPDRPVPLVGGVASGASQPGHNVLMVNDEFIQQGAVGVSIGGDLDLDYVVSQGCRPIGSPLVVTRAERNVIHELGGRRPVEIMQQIASSMSEEDRALLSSGVLFGTVINEYKDRFGRGDFLVRNLLGINQEKGSIAVGDRPRVGQTVQFHVRDADAASEDLQLLLDAQQLRKKPLGAMLFTCNGRGMRLFERRDHDISIIRERLDNVPVAGFFAAGEIGPIGDRTFLHGHTAVLALFRPRRAG